MNQIIKIENLSFYREKKCIFENINLQIKTGELIVFMGPSGTGKTTLLKLIGGQLHPDQGKIIFDEENIHQLKMRDLFRLRRKMGMLFQSGALFNEMTVFDNIAFPIRQQTNFKENLIRTLVLMKLEAVGLRGAKNLYPSELSGGMTRRVALARAIALDPKLIMYDEPFTGQDPISIGVLLKLIKLLNKTFGMTSIIVSHDIQESFSIADKIIIFSNNKIIAEGSPKELQNTESIQVKQFINGYFDGPVKFNYPCDLTIKEDLLL